MVMPCWTALISMGLGASQSSSPQTSIVQMQLRKPVQAYLIRQIQSYIFLDWPIFMVFDPKNSITF